MVDKCEKLIPSNGDYANYKCTETGLPTRWPNNSPFCSSCKHNPSKRAPKSPYIKRIEKKICTIFNDNKHNLEAIRGGVYAFDRFYPSIYRGNEKYNELSRHIYNIKYYYKVPNSTPFEERKSSLDHIYNKFELVLNFSSEFTICVIPSSKKGLQESAIRTIARKLVRNHNENEYLILDGTNVLVRTETRPSKHSEDGVRGNVDYDIESLAIQNEDLIKKKQVLLLDDVATSGGTLKAGKEVLLEAGADIVVPFAAGATYHEYDEDYENLKKMFEQIIWIDY